MKKTNMKPAFIDQVLFWFLLLALAIGFIGTVADRDLAKDQFFNIERVTTAAAKAAANSYMMNGNMNQSQNMANDIISQGNLGQELLNKGVLSYVWRDTTGDGQPNTVTAQVVDYAQENFWSKFFDTESFILNADFSALVTREDAEEVGRILRFGGSNAGYHNVIGTYELDANGCVINPQLVLVNKENWNIGDEIGRVDNPNTRYFIVPDGFDRFGNRTMDVENSSVTIINQNNCNPPNIPEVIIDGIASNVDRPVYFQDTQFNTDNGYDHMHEIGKTFHDDYLDFLDNPPSKTIEETVTTTKWVCKKYKKNGKCKKWKEVEVEEIVTTTVPYEDTWEGWVEYADDENIDFENDPNNEYIIAMEDLPNGGDKDFNDILLDTTKIIIPGVVDTKDIQDADILEP